MSCNVSCLSKGKERALPHTRANAQQQTAAVWT